MKVVNYKGEVQTIPDENLSSDEKENVLKAARINLGTFGIIVEMTVNVSPMENVQVDNFFNITLADVYGSTDALSGYLKKYWSLHILWIPFSSLDLSKAALQPLFPSLVGWDPDKDYVYLRGINKAGDHEEPKYAINYCSLESSLWAEATCQIDTGHVAFIDRCNCRLICN